jgi:hypothetical protein
MLSKQVRIQQLQLLKIRQFLRINYNDSDSRMIGIVWLIQRIQSIISGHSGFFLSFSKNDSPMSKISQSTIVQAVKHDSPMKR